MRQSLRALTALFVLFSAAVTLAQTEPSTGSPRPAIYRSEKFTAENWVKNTAYVIGNRVVNGTNVFQCTTAGTSENADNVGPKTVSTDITDGTAHWKWLGTTAALGIDNTSTAGEVALASPVVSTLNLESLTFIAKATGTSSDRVLTVSCLAQDGTTALFTFPTVAVAANTSALVEIRPDMKQEVQYFPAWAASTAYILGARVTNGGNLYQVITAGTSAASGGPTTTSADITDNTVHWAYQGAAGSSAITGVTFWNVTLCPKIKASMAAISAGSGITADLATYGRKVVTGTPVTKVAYESGSVASGAAISKTINAAALESVQVLVEATTTGRALVVSCMSEDGVQTLFSYPSFTVAAGQKYMRTYRFDTVVRAAAIANVTHLPVDNCPMMKFSIAATGAASAKLAIYTR